jgi:quercetin dioxygenase-like cupin family protein
MKHSKLIPVMVAVVFATFLALSSVLTLHAQQIGEIKRNVLTKQDLSAPGREGLLVLVELAPGAREARHTHPGELFAYVQEGAIIQNQEGTPTVTVKAGEAYFVPTGTVHWAECAGPTPCKVLVAFVLEKGKPLSSPAK